MLFRCRWIAALIVKFSIRLKLFLTLLLAVISVVLCMYLVMQRSFDQGFLNYVNKQEQQTLEALTQNLAKEWQKNLGWQRLKNDRHRWHDLLNSVLESRPPPPQHRPPRAGDRRPPPPPGHRPPVLLDRDKSVIVGHPGDTGDIGELVLFPIKIDPGSREQIVGYLGQLPKKELTDQLDLSFVEQQTDTFMLVTAIMILVSLMTAFPIAAHLVRPIKHLTDGTRKLTRGHFDMQIPVTSKDELGQLSENFNTLAATLKENESARQRWVADISHELRTPIAVLKGEIEAMQDGVRETNASSINSLHGEVEHLSRLVGDLYELSMSDIGALNYQKESLDPLNILESCVEAYKETFHQHGLVVHFNRPSAQPAKVLADATRIKQLFDNLLNNSLRYTDAPGKLVIDAEVANGHLSLCFNDSAPGVSENELAQLFERLYRVESSRNRRFGGAGLGLAICSNIVAAHNGTITAESSRYGGICIRIDLPLSSDSNP